ncbi:hypothetical protein D3C78_1549130 [compost metagenome]
MPLALAERQPQQAHEDRQVVAAARRDRQGLGREQFEQLFQGCARRVRPGLAAVQFLFETGAERPEEAREDRLDQRLFRAEMVIHRGQVHPGLAGDQAQRSLREALFREQLFSGIEDAFDGF